MGFENWTNVSIKASKFSFLCENYIDALLLIIYIYKVEFDFGDFDTDKNRSIVKNGHIEIFFFTVVAAAVAIIVVAAARCVLS